MERALCLESWRHESSIESWPLLCSQVCALCLRLPCGRGSVLGEGVKLPLSEQEGIHLVPYIYACKYGALFKHFTFQGNPELKPQGPQHTDNVYTPLRKQHDCGHWLS